MNKSTLICAALASATFASGSLAGDTIPQTFDLFDHPSGAVNPQAYGLRLDGVNSGNPMTFSFGDSQANSTMTMQVVELMGGGIEVRMFGTVTGNSASGGTDLGSFALDVTYTVTGNETDGWEDGGTGNGVTVGTITGDFDNDGGTADTTVTLSGKLSAGDTFRFLSDGHRIGGDSDTWVGRGWVIPDGVMGSTNDFLFQGALVPLPAAAWGGLAMLGGLVVARRIRK